jgi:hypothetical protein
LHSRKELVAGGAIFIESPAQGLERDSLLGFVVPHPFVQESDEGNWVGAASLRLAGLELSRVTVEFGRFRHFQGSIVQRWRRARAMLLRRGHEAGGGRAYARAGRERRAAGNARQFPVPAGVRHLTNRPIRLTLKAKLYFDCIPHHDRHRQKQTALVVPPSVRRQAGLKSGQEIEFKVVGSVISIRPKPPAAGDEYPQAATHR